MKDTMNILKAHTTRCFFVRTFLLLFFIFCTESTHPEGFHGNTEVEASQGGLKKIKDLRVGDEVVCYNKEMNPRSEMVTAIEEEEEESMVEIITFDGTCIITSKKSKIYLPLKKKWVKVKKLKRGDRLLKNGKEETEISSIEEKWKPTKFYKITVDNNHNFLITKNGILVHNYAAVFQTVGQWIATNGPVILSNVQAAAVQAGQAIVSGAQAAGQAVVNVVVSAPAVAVVVPIAVANEVKDSLEAAEKVRIAAQIAEQARIAAEIAEKAASAVNIATKAAEVAEPVVAIAKEIPFAASSQGMSAASIFQAIGNFAANNAARFNFFAQLFASAAPHTLDYSIPHLSGELGQTFDLKGKSFTYTESGWKSTADLSSLEKEDLGKKIAEKQKLAQQQKTAMSIDMNAFVEPEYSYVTREGYTKDGFWYPVGARLYEECITYSADRTGIDYYDRIKDALISKRIAEQRKAAEQKSPTKNKSDTSNENNGCKCGCGCKFECGCTCGCGCSWKERQQRKKEIEERNKNPNGEYEDAGYHHKNSNGNSKNGKSPSPKNGQKALNNSIELLGDGTGRIGVSEGQIVILSKTLSGKYHGHAISLKEFLSAKTFHGMLKKMIEAGLMDTKGNILK